MEGRSYNITTPTAVTTTTTATKSFILFETLISYKPRNVVKKQLLRESLKMIPLEKKQFSKSTITLVGKYHFKDKNTDNRTMFIEVILVSLQVNLNRCSPWKSSISNLFKVYNERSEMTLTLS